MDQLTQGIHELARYIDHTILKPDVTAQQVEQICNEAIEHQFYSVCIPPSYVPLASKILKPTKVKVCTVIGFPFGYNSSAAKTFEAKIASEQGAHELDMVINVSALKSGQFNLVADDIQSVVNAARGSLIKVILETCYLNRDEKIRACELAVQAGAHFVKTSTGFGPSGATEEDIHLMCEAVAGRASVKASGGIRDTATAVKMIQAGAKRLGTSQSIAILKGFSGQQTDQY